MTCHVRPQGHPKEVSKLLNTEKSGTPAHHAT
jgi:hypothetical protein